MLSGIFLIEIRVVCAEREQAFLLPGGDLMLLPVTA